MIPIIYKLRADVRFENRDSFSLVISEAPLNVVRTSKRAVQILHLCDGVRALRQIAEETGAPGEEEVFKICDYFNRKAVLETVVAENQGFFPTITVIIPTRNRAEMLGECLKSVFSQDYPPNRVDVIVVNDGSRDETESVVRRFRCTLLISGESRGQSYSRNLAVQHAKGEILAFLDDDCVAGRSWLKALAPYLQWEELGAVGGYVDGYSDRSPLDRYEKKFSLLNLGNSALRGANDQSTFYVPMCNMLVRKRAFVEIGGLREALHLGEDVDFCWRMRDAGWHVLYVPTGSVLHKHRNKLGLLLRRRADYGTSESILYGLHPGKRKILPLRFTEALAFLGLCGAAGFLLPRLLILTGAGFAAEAAAKVFKLRAERVHIRLGRILSSVLRMHLSFFYLMSFHLVRYYLLALLLSGFIVHSLWFLSMFLLILTAVVDYSAKRPQLSLPLFLFYYVLDQISYQLGVLAGCLRARTFHSYRVSWGRSTALRPAKQESKCTDVPANMADKANRIT